MTDRNLYDSTNRLLGIIRELPSGRQALYDPNNCLLGHYDANTNMTHDANNRFVGTGNLLTTLLR